MRELIAEAKKRVNEIAKLTKNCPAGKYVAIYESEAGYTVSTIQRGWDTRTRMINFGSEPLTRLQVTETILREMAYA